MKTNTIGLTSSASVGYSNSVKALLGLYEQSKTIDVEEVCLASELVSVSQTNCLDVISCGNYGFLAFNALLENETVSDRYKNGMIRFVLASDRFFSGSLELFSEGITLIMPERAIKEYKAKNQEINVLGVSADLVAHASKESMELASSAFISANTESVEKFRSISFGLAVFLGGCIEIDGGAWIENTSEIFRKESERLMSIANGRNFFVATHGLRTFTKADKTLDMEPYLAFVEVIKSQIAEGQHAVLFAKDGGKPVMEVIYCKDEEVKAEKIFLNDPSNSYNFLLQETAMQDVEIYVTVEQMNFLPELKAMGGRFDRMCV